MLEHVTGAWSPLTLVDRTRHDKAHTNISQAEWKGAGALSPDGRPQLLVAVTWPRCGLGRAPGACGRPGPGRLGTDSSRRYQEIVTLILFIVMALLWFSRDPGFVPGWSALFSK